MPEHFLKRYQVLGSVVEPSRKRVPQGIEAEWRDGVLNCFQDPLVHPDETRVSQRPVKTFRSGTGVIRTFREHPTATSVGNAPGEKPLRCANKPQRPLSSSCLQVSDGEQSPLEINVFDPDLQAFASWPDALLEKQTGKVPERVMLVGTRRLCSDLLACEHQFISRVTVAGNFYVDEWIVFEPSVILSEASALTSSEYVISESDLEPSTLPPPSQVIEHVPTLPDRGGALPHEFPPARQRRRNPPYRLRLFPMLRPLVCRETVSGLRERRMLNRFRLAEL